MTGVQTCALPISIERWSGTLRSDAEGRTLLTQTWEVLASEPLDEQFIKERRKSILEYYKFLDPYLERGVETYAKNIKNSQTN